MIRKLLAVTAIVCGLGAFVGAEPAAAAGPSGCGYGTGGPEAGAICWLDMSAYDDATAKSPAGQPMSATLPGGYHVSFVVKSGQFLLNPYRPLKAAAFPTWAGSYIGNSVYLNTPGKPGLYGTSGGGGTLVTLDDIAVTDAGGNPLTSYAFVVADAEATGPNESIKFHSDKPLQAVYPSTAQFPYCTNHLNGLGTTDVTCDGSAPPCCHYGALALQANSPTKVSAGLVHGGLEGVAFAFVTADVTLVKQVVRRINPTDSFDVAIAQGPALGTGTTGSADSATTGKVVVLNTDPVTLQEAATTGSGTSLGAYSQNWSCTNSATSSTTVLPSGSGTSKQLSLQPGDDVTCTLTNAGPPIVDTPMAEWDVVAGLALIALLTAGGVIVVRRRQQGDAS